MKQGAVAVLDALGFKGIWKIPDNERKVIAVMKQLATMADSFEHDVSQMSADPTGHLAHAFLIRLFSDSVIISCCSRFKFERMLGIDPARKAALELSFTDVLSLVSLYFVTTMVAQVCALTSSTDPVLLYRGAIACGSIEATEECFVGPAIDEAASMMNEPDGAIVLLCPSATSVLRKSTAEDLPEELRASSALARQRAPLILEYPVPLRDGRTYLTEIVNPLMWAADPPYQAEAMLRSFDRAAPLTLAVALKKQNTADLLGRAALDTKGSSLRKEIEMRRSGSSAA